MEGTTCSHLPTSLSKKIYKVTKKIKLAALFVSILQMELATPSEDTRAAWREQQEQIALRIIDSDAFQWDPLSTSPLYVAGVDISFSPDNERDAVATAVIVEYTQSTNKNRLVFSTSARVQVDTPYAAGYLAFRELPLAMKVLNALPKSGPRPHALLVDGNGVLHHRGAGLACHLGLELDIPTIGIGKNLLRVDGLDDQVVKESTGKSPTGCLDLVGDSGRTWGAALLAGNAVSKPIFVSVGHKISLPTALKLVRKLCKFRVPEPVRMADHHSREALRSGKLIKVRAKDIYSDA